MWGLGVACGDTNPQQIFGFAVSAARPRLTICEHTVDLVFGFLKLEMIPMYLTAPTMDAIAGAKRLLGQEQKIIGVYK